MAAVYSQTRFSSSAFVQWKRLYKSYRLFVEALTEASDEMTNEDSPLQYKAQGQVGHSFQNFVYIFTRLR